MTMLEKLARAIELWVPEDCHQKEHAEAVSLQIARAALLAIREPSEAMEEVGAPWTDGVLPGRAFTAMIDAILAEGDKARLT